MQAIAPSLLAFLIAAAIAFLELITKQYPRTYFLLRKDGWLYLYAFVYGAVAFLIMLGLDTLIASGAVKIEGLGLSSQWTRSVAVGLSAKAFLHINLFNVTTGLQSMPVGIESLVQLFEPAILRQILLNEFNTTRAYIQPYAEKYANPGAYKDTMKQNIPHVLSVEERTAFERDLEKAESVTQAMELFLRFLGKKTFERVFPL